MAYQIVKEEKEAFHIGLLTFKVAQLVWQNSGGQGQAPKLRHYIPGYREPQQSIEEMIAICNLMAGEHAHPLFEEEH